MKRGLWRIFINDKITFYFIILSYYLFDMVYLQIVCFNCKLYIHIKNNSSQRFNHNFSFDCDIKYIILKNEIDKLQNDEI